MSRPPLTTHLKSLMSDSAIRLLIVVINERERLDEILHGFLALGVTGATIINTEGMGRILSDDIPVFAGLQAAVGGERPKNITIMTVMAAERVDELIGLVKDVCGDLDAPATGIAFVMPVERVIGLAPRLGSATDAEAKSAP